MEQEGRGNADEGYQIADAVIDSQGAFADVVRAQREDSVDKARDASCRLRLQDDVAAVVEPDFYQQHSHQVPEVDESEHRHGGGAVGGQIHFERTFRMSEVQLEREGGNE